MRIGCVLLDFLSAIVTTKHNQVLPCFRLFISIQASNKKCKKYGFYVVYSAFIGSFLFKLLEDDVNMEQLNSISDEKLREYLTFANAYAAYSTTKKGAIGSYATLDEIIKYMDK